MQELVERIRQKKNFVVTSHVNPDGDNIGSSVAMTRYLRSIGKDAVHILDDDIPENLKFLLSDHEILRSDRMQDNKLGLDSYDLIVVDCSVENRIAIAPNIIEEADCVLNIDHHMSNTNFGDINFILPEVSSTCEVLTGVLRNIDEDAIGESVATALYTGISTDTGNFLFPAVNEKTFQTAAFLTTKGADRVTIANELYRNESLESRKLTRLVLETFQIENRIGMIVMTQAMLEESGVDYKDTDFIANIPIDTKGVSVGILIKERAEGEYKISVRSKERVDVCEIAKKFDGGGHYHASGCTICGEISEVIEQLQKVSEEQILKDLGNG